jgi:ADP-heptose:LPS heptosyltransferase
MSFSEKNTTASAKAHILVIRLSAMGDVAMTVPVLRCLVRTYPNLKITVLSRTFFKPIFDDIPNTTFYAADVNGVHSGVIGLGRLAKDLRDEGIQKVADLHNVLRSNILKSVFFLFGIPVAQIDKGRDEKKALTRESDKVLKPLKSTHQRYADVFAELGYPIDLSSYSFPKKKNIPKKIVEILGNKPGKWLGIAPFAQHVSKVYPLELMEEVIARLTRETDFQIFLFGGGEAEKQKLQNLSAAKENVYNLAGKVDFSDELALISNLDAMISMDSGNGHLAAMYGVPVLSIWGVTHPFAGFKPFMQPEENSLLPDLNKYPKIPTSVYGDKYPEGYENATRSITPDAVVTRIKSMLLGE